MRLNGLSVFNKWAFNCKAKHCKGLSLKSLDEVGWFEEPSHGIVREGLCYGNNLLYIASSFCDALLFFFERRVNYQYTPSFSLYCLVHFTSQRFFGLSNSYSICSWISSKWYTMHLLFLLLLEAESCCTVYCLSCMVLGRQLIYSMSASLPPWLKWCISYQ